MVLEVPAAEVGWAEAPSVTACSDQDESRQNGKGATTDRRKALRQRVSLTSGLLRFATLTLTRFVCAISFPSRALSYKYAPIRCAKTARAVLSAATSTSSALSVRIRRSRSVTARISTPATACRLAVTFTGSSKTRWPVMCSFHLLLSHLAAKLSSASR